MWALGDSMILILAIEERGFSAGPSGGGFSEIFMGFWSNDSFSGDFLGFQDGVSL